jgi:hypothetical protein
MQIEEKLQKYLEEFEQGTSHPALDFIRYNFGSSADPQVTLEITKDSAYKWAKKNCNIEITEWKPAHEGSSKDFPVPAVKPQPEETADNSYRPSDIHSKQGDNFAESETLLLTLAWCLDTSMEIQVDKWKEVMADKGRTRGQAWFRGSKLNIATVIDAITPEFGNDPLSESTTHKHIAAARKVILHHWGIEEPFKKRELKAAYRTLLAVSSAAIRSAIKTSGTDDSFDDLIQSPQKCASFLCKRNAIPTCLSKDEIEACLNKYWE